MREIPAWQQVAFVRFLPFGGGGVGISFLIEGAPAVSHGTEPTSAFNCITPDYFQALSIPILRGRAFTELDGEQTELVAVVNNTLAQKYFPNGDPVNRRIK